MKHARSHHVVTTSAAWLPKLSLPLLFSIACADDELATAEALTSGLCASASENQTAKLTCPAGQTIASIDFASYGTPSGSCGAFTQGTCHATTSTSAVSSRCLGKASCSVPATNAVFGDPCWGTTKRLRVQFTCSDTGTSGGSTSGGSTSGGSTSGGSTSSGSTSGGSASGGSTSGGTGGTQVCQTAGEGADLSLTCPAGTVFAAIDFASYGTPSGSCGAFTTGSCAASSSKSVVEGACLGKASCTVPATNQTFGDPCVGTYKSLFVQGTCSAAGGGTAGGSSGTTSGGSTGSTSGSTGGTTGGGDPSVNASFTKVVIDSASPNNPWAKAMGDLNGDGYLDMIVGGDGSQAVWYRFDPSTGGFTRHTLGASNTESGSAIVDMSGDGFVDVVVGTSWYENPRRSGGSVTGAWVRRTPFGGGGHDIRVGDLDGDGKIDVVLRPETASPLTIHFQDSKTAFTQKTVDPGFGRNGLEIFDVDRDGRLDLVSPGKWMRNPGNRTGSWTAYPYGTQSDYAAMDVADMNNDGRLDLIATNSEQIGGNIAWYENPVSPTSTTTWTKHAFGGAIDYAHSATVEDMNLDGNLDVVVSEFSGQGRLLVYYNLGNGIDFRTQVVGTTSLHNHVTGDYDNDGDVDIMGVGAFGQNPVEVWRNDLRSGIGAAPKIQVFSKTVSPGFRHTDGITEGIKMIKSIGAMNAIVVDATEDASTYTSSNLAQYRAVVFLNPAGDVFTDAQMAAFEGFIRAGKGFVGIHNATALGYGIPHMANWTFYQDMIGSSFASEGSTTSFQVPVKTHVSTVGFPDVWPLSTETYTFSPALGPNFTTLVRLDANNPISWTQIYQGARIWYTEIGAYASDYKTPLYRRHVEGGILYAAKLR